MKNILTLFVAFFIATTSFATDKTELNQTAKAQKWAFDKAHSAVTFNVRHFFTPVVGQFNEYSGDVYFDAKNLKESSINVTINVNSIDTKNEKRDAHLQSQDFFNSSKFPKISFVSTEIVDKGNNKYVAKGKLTIKDVSKNIELPFTLLGTMAHPFMKDGTLLAAFEASLKLNRNEYTVGAGDFIQTAVVGEEVDIKITLEMNSVK